MANKITIAEAISEQFGHDNRTFTDENGTEIEAVCRKIVPQPKEINDSLSFCFKDNSRIVIYTDCWDIVPIDCDCPLCKPQVTFIN